MADYMSALNEVLKPGLYGQVEKGQPFVSISEKTGLHLTQISFFVSQKSSMHKFLDESYGCGLPQAGGVSQGKIGRRHIFAARLEPSKIMLISPEAITDIPDAFYPLDVSDARTLIDISGTAATKTLSRLCALDFSDGSFPVGAFATTGMHHIGVSIWHNKDGYRLFVPRSYAASLYHLILQIAEQFGCEVLGTA